MSNFGGWAKVLIITGGALTVTACASYPTEPRYSIRADQPSRPAPGAYPNQPYQTQPYQTHPGQPYPGTVNEVPPPMTAPIESIEGGALGSPSTTSSLNGGPARPAQSSNYPASNYPAPAYNPPANDPLASSGSTYNAPNYSPPTYTPPAQTSGAGLAYVIQPGDTLSGVGRRFQTPVQSLIDLNNLGPRGTITAGQRISLPDAAVDTGSDPYATGPAPVGVTVPRAGRVPPPPPPPSGNAALPAASRLSAPAPAPVQSRASAPQSQAAAAPVSGSIPLQWPVRGDIVKAFGPVAMGERNNGINIGASAGAVVSASAAGRVAYVGNDVAGQGLMVVIVHRDGWRTVYAQLGSATVENNADVRAGQQIGTVGLTAGDGRPSIHFETRRMQGDNPVAVDPVTVLPR